MKTASYAVMFTDIKGFTERTARQTRAENERLIRLHEALLLPVIEGFGGRRVKTIGDAYLVVFDSATRAIACGAALQDRLAIFNRRVDPSERIEVRVAINAGEIRVERDDVYGEAVNVASRVEEHTDGGEVCFTEAVHLIADRTAIDAEDLGPHSLRGLPEPVRLYRLRRAPGDGLPYGGGALASLQLPDPDPATLARWRLGRIAPGRAIAALAALLAIGAGLWLLADGPSLVDEIEGLADEGRVGEAERRLQSLPPDALRESERLWLTGVVAEGRGHWAQAIQQFSAAAALDADLGEERAVPRLVRLLDHESCEVRAAAARSLGELQAGAARTALEALAKREPAAEGFLARLRLGGCNAGDAARRALERIASGG